jgi:ABC-type Na+ efflux pump permease subunit
MTWFEVIDLVGRTLPALILAVLVTSLLLVVGWLALVEGLQGSDHIIVHIFEVFFQSKGIEGRELSEWRIIFGMAAIFGGIAFGVASLLALFIKTLCQAMDSRPEQRGDTGSMS